MLTWSRKICEHSVHVHTPFILCHAHVSDENLHFIAVSLNISKPDPGWKPNDSNKVDILLIKLLPCMIFVVFTVVMV
jgi:hypothetical protein